MGDWQPLLNSVGLAMLASLLSAVTVWWFARSRRHEVIADKLADEQDKRDLRITELEAQLRMVGQSITPIAAAMQALFIKELTHDGEPELDGLLQCLGPPSSLTSEMSDRLHVLLEIRSRMAATEAERDVAVMMPMMIKRVALEWVSTQVGEIQSVLLPTNAGENPAPTTS